MTNTAYIIAAIVVAVSYATLATYMRHIAGVRALWLTAIATILVLAVGGLADWYQLSAKETPLHTYMLLATVPTLMAASLINGLAARRVALAVQVTVAAIAWLVTGLVTLLSGFYP